MFLFTSFYLFPFMGLFMNFNLLIYSLCSYSYQFFVYEDAKIMKRDEHYKSSRYNVIIHRYSAVDTICGISCLGESLPCRPNTLATCYLTEWILSFIITYFPWYQCDITRVIIFWCHIVYSYAIRRIKVTKTGMGW
jgi:hypothetical protein